MLIIQGISDTGTLSTRNDPETLEKLERSVAATQYPGEDSGETIAPDTDTWKCAWCRLLDRFEQTLGGYGTDCRHCRPGILE
jgi:hypothetical protein